MTVRVSQRGAALQNYPPTPDYFVEVLSKVVAIISDHFSVVGQNNHKVASLEPLSELRDKFSLVNRTRGGSSEGRLLSTIVDYLGLTTRLDSPRFIGHQTAPPGLGSIVADLIQACTNNSTAAYDMAPAGNAIELEVIDWMLGKIGWNSDQSGGVLTHGGSLANLTCMLAVRANKLPEAWTKGVNQEVIAFVPDISHYSIERALAIIGIGSHSVLRVETNERGQMQIETLENAIIESKRQGKIPFLLCANAGSTVLGSFDDFEILAKIAERYKMWFHVDGAHGMSASLSSEFQSLLKGAHLADSIVWDAHKLLQCSSLCAAVLFKNRLNLGNVFNQNASYLNLSAETFGTFPYTVECTHPVIGLKIYLTLILEGEDSLRRNIELLFNNTKIFAELINREIDFETAHIPQANILLFSYRGSSDQKQVYDKVLASGKFHITYALFKERGYLRLTVMNPLTSTNDIAALLELIRS